MVSRVFDRKNTPRYAIEYLMYHEMLHLKHPVKVRADVAACIHANFRQKRNSSQNLSWPKRTLSNFRNREASF